MHTFKQISINFQRADNIDIGLVVINYSISISFLQNGHVFSEKCGYGSRNQYFFRENLKNYEWWCGRQNRKNYNISYLR